MRGARISLAEKNSNFTSGEKEKNHPAPGYQTARREQVPRPSDNSASDWVAMKATFAALGVASISYPFAVGLAKTPTGPSCNLYSRSSQTRYTEPNGSVSGKSTSSVSRHRRAGSVNHELRRAQKWSSSDWLYELFRLGVFVDFESESRSPVDRSSGPPSRSAS
jgi:hypothetical protein